jgi:hypothetical protein
MQTALNVMRMVAEGRRTVPVRELADLLDFSIYEARVWSAAVCGNSVEIPVSTLLAQVVWVPYASALRYLPGKLHNAAFRRRRVFYDGSDPFHFVHVRDLLILLGRHRGTLKCLNHLITSRPEIDPATGRKVFWGPQRTSRSF